MHNIGFDLAETDKLPELLSNLLDHVAVDDCEGLYLVNNAGIVEPVKTIEKVSVPEVKKIFRINLLAPVVLSSGFIKYSHLNDY